MKGDEVVVGTTCRVGGGSASQTCKLVVGTVKRVSSLSLTTVTQK